MLVKKVNPEWFPSENKSLRVGETIEITDPKTLVLNGDAVIVDEATGQTKSAFDLYGTFAKGELEELLEFKKLKEQEVIANKLAEEKAALEAKLSEVTKKEEAKVEEKKVETEVKKK